MRSLAGDRFAEPRAAVVAVGTAVPPESYSQEEVLDALGIAEPRVRSLFFNSAIERRHLTLPPPGADGTRVLETQGELLRKHVACGVEIGSEAVATCLERAAAEPAQVRHLCCVSSTGFISPGLSALLIKRLGLSPTCSRVDVVGMGCNAGLNALAAVAGWTAMHPGEFAVMACIEVCSAAYAFDGTMRTAVVNSLFGDGAAAIALVRDDREGRPGPRILRFASRMIPRRSMRCATTGTSSRAASASRR
jgi:3,5-dihydroxyphenylacetyl-CoA synthase